MCESTPGCSAAVCGCWHGSRTAIAVTAGEHRLLTRHSISDLLHDSRSASAGTVAARLCRGSAGWPRLHRNPRCAAFQRYTITKRRTSRGGGVPPGSCTQLNYRHSLLGCRVCERCSAPGSAFAVIYRQRFPKMAHFARGKPPGSCTQLNYRQANFIIFIDYSCMFNVTS